MMAGFDTSGPGVDGGPAGHMPVLLDEVAEHLAPVAGGVFIDGTFGAGGYSRSILVAGGTVVAIDRDPHAIAGGAGMLRTAPGRLTLVEGRFGALDEIAEAAGYLAVDGVVLDIGVSSMQLDQAERGFSFAKDGPLDMRMEADGPSAADIVNEADPALIAAIVRELGEEKKAGLVARAIARARAERPITRTAELAAVVERAVGRRPTDTIHPATRTFQALRIYVNRELEQLADGLAAAERALREGGRLVVVTFHSLEDRIVKRFLADRTRDRAGGSRHLPEQQVERPTFALAGRGVVTAGPAELARNPRARSAKLRAARRTAAPPRPVDHAALGVPVLAAAQRRRA